MNRVIGFAFFLLLLAAVAFISLKDMRPIAASKSAAEYVEIDWRPVSIGGRSVAADGGLALRFEKDGKFTGHGGCNRFFGSYTISASGIETGPIGATRMACPEPQMNLEQKFLDALGNTTGIAVQANRLMLSDDSGHVLVVLKHASQPAAGS